MRKIIYCLVILLSSSFLLAQADLDSLVKICAKYKDSNSDSLSIYARKGLSLAEKENNEAMLTIFDRYVGISCFQKQNYDTASIYLNKALESAIKRKDRKEEANAYLAIGYMHSSQSEIKLMIEYFLKALPIFEALNDNEKMIETLVGVGSAYRRTGNDEIAVKYLNRAKDRLKDSKNAFLISLTYFELGTVEPDINKEIAYELKTIEYARIAKIKQLETLGNQALAYAYLNDLKDYDKALIYANECYRLACEQGEASYIYSALTILSDIYYDQAKYKECEIVSLQAWAMDSTNFIEARALASKIVKSNIHLKNEEKAIAFFEKYEELTEGYTKESYHKDVIEMGTKYETEKKEMRITSLEKERRMYVWLGIAGSLLAISLGVVLWQTMRNAHKEKQLIAAKSVQDGEMGERARIAEDLHDRLGGSLSAVKIELKSAENLQNVSDKLDECIKEIREITHNLMPRSLLSFGLKTALEDFSAQFPNVHFHFFGKEKRIRERLEFIIYCCANELVTNSLRYSGAKEINMQLIQGEKHVSLTVQDDGCGFDEKNVTAGIGLKNIRDRVASCNGKLDIASTPGKGTETVIELRVES